MNRMLADALGALNAVIGVLIIILAAIGGVMSGGIIGLLIGLVTGAVFAIFTCGMIAVFVEMRREIVGISQFLQTGTAAEPSSAVTRMTGAVQNTAMSAATRTAGVAASAASTAASALSGQPMSKKERYNDANLFKIADGLIFGLKNPTQFLVFQNNTTVKHAGVEAMEAANPATKARELIRGDDRTAIVSRFEDYIISQMDDGA